MSFPDTIKVIHDCLDSFIDKIKEKYNYTDDQIKAMINRIDITGKIKIKKTECQITCENIMKSGNRKGQKCGGRVKEGNLCARHIKSGDMESSKEKIELDYEYTAKLNRHGKYEFGKTGLIFKSQTEIYIIGKQLDNGTIIKLCDEDKELCRKHKLKYVKS